jgi:hypothetical protein
MVRLELPFHQILEHEYQQQVEIGMSDCGVVPDSERIISILVSQMSWEVRAC